MSGGGINMEETGCELNGEVFQNDSVTCVGNVCLRCSDGIWQLIFFPLRSD